jgi:hypothetical protein
MPSNTTNSTNTPQNPNNANRNTPKNANNANNANRNTSRNASNVATILADTATNAQTKARLSLVAKQLKDRLNLGALSTTKMIRSLKELRDNGNKYLKIKFPIKPLNIQTQKPFPLVDHLYIELSPHETKFGVWLGFEENVYWDNEDVTNWDNISATISEYSKVLEDLKYIDLFEIRSDYKADEFIHIQLSISNETMHVVNYICNHFMDITKEPTISTCETTDPLAKCSDESKQDAFNIVKSWFVYGNPKKGGRPIPLKITFEGKVRNVHMTPLGKYILKNKEKVFLSSIRGKYRYV